jgi:hypothetical protein
MWLKQLASLGWDWSTGEPPSMPSVHAIHGAQMLSVHLLLPRSSVCLQCGAPVETVSKPKPLSAKGK